ncbi:MAG: [NiFe]-hydrogenase assembly chaperone HybE [Thiomargarita sp.]|nr:[NiFe]-hydrogenase assembly chaperone HybE [Thiomargarita sp.]
MSDWQLLNCVDDDDAIVKQVLAVFSQLYQDYFLDELIVNHSLPIEIRAFRHSDIWCVFLLLTPWMLARVFIPTKLPKLVIPTNWQAEKRKLEPMLVIGPAMPLDILGGEEQANLNYHPNLGHYLIQPLVQSMEKFKTPDETFAAWNEVIKIRNQVIEEQNKECGWHQEVSRREFFAKLRQRGAK